MSNLNQIVHPATVADNRIVQSPAVNAAVGSDFNIVPDNNPAQLRNALMLTVNHLKTETVLADSRSGKNITVIAHNRIADRGINPDAAIITDLAAAADNGACFNHTIDTDFDFFANNNIIADTGIFTDNRRGMNPCR